jgi:hypothetical protein
MTQKYQFFTKLCVNIYNMEIYMSNDDSINFLLDI